jgi:hypothetical protein
VPANQGLREALQFPEGLLNPNFDIEYRGFNSPGTTEIMVDARGDDEYRLKFVNVNGDSYDIPLAEVTSQGILRYGEDTDEDLDFVESDFQLSNSAESYYIDRHDKFVLTNNDDPDEAVSKVWSYEQIDTANDKITFLDLATGNSIDVTYDASSQPGVEGEFELALDEVNHSGYIGMYSGYPLAIDLNGDGDIDQDEIRITTKGGAIIDLGDGTGTESDRIDNKAFTLEIRTLNDHIEESDSDEVVGVKIDEVLTDITITEVTGVTLYAPGDNATYSLGMTEYGAIYDLYEQQTRDPYDSKELIVTYPVSQLFAQVFLVG